MSWFWVALATAALQLLLAEAFDWFPWLAERVIRRAARLLPHADRDRYEEEWLAELDALPGRKISTLVFALGVLVNSPSTRRELAATKDGAALKRAVDVLAGGLGLLLLAPALGAIALALKVTTGGPVFVAQRRVGRDNREFRMWKFCTMVDGASVMEESPAALNHLGLFDPRVTPVGRLLRRTRYDELPQLWNVVRSQMTFLGFVRRLLRTNRGRL